MKGTFCKTEILFDLPYNFSYSKDECEGSLTLCYQEVARKDHREV